MCADVFSADGSKTIDWCCKAVNSAAEMKPSILTWQPPAHRLASPIQCGRLESRAKAALAALALHQRHAPTGGVPQPAATASGERGRPARAHGLSRLTPSPWPLFTLGVAGAAVPGGCCGRGWCRSPAAAGARAARRAAAAGCGVASGGAATAGHAFCKEQPATE